MSDIHDKLTAAFTAYQEENAKFSEKGVKAAGSKARGRNRTNPPSDFVGSWSSWLPYRSSRTPYARLPFGYKQNYPISSLLTTARNVWVFASEAQDWARLARVRAAQARIAALKHPDAPVTPR